jgi:hypothetical protein
MSDLSRSNGPPGDAAQDLKATTDSIIDDLGRLAAVEGEKQRLDPADPEIGRLSGEAVEIAGRIDRQAKAEQQLSRVVR